MTVVDDVDEPDILLVSHLKAKYIDDDDEVDEIQIDDVDEVFEVDEFETANGIVVVGLVLVDFDDEVEEAIFEVEVKVETE